MAPLVFLLTIMVSCLFCTIEGQSVRLVTRIERTSSYVTAGRLEVLYNGQWGSVCNSDFDYKEASVACRQLGFSSYRSYGIVGISGKGFEAASNSTPIWHLYCSSSSYSSLSSCSKSSSYYGCTHEQDVALSCLGDGALRLTGYYYDSPSSSGRLEVYHNGRWGTVCDRSFDQTDADVACRQLGYASASRYGSVGTLGYSQGYGTIWLDYLGCTSTDFVLSKCSHNGFVSTNCHHSQDVAVSCSSTGTIRLVAKGEHTSSALTAGRLEVYHSGRWGTVCNDGFYSTAATIACHQLGFARQLSYATVGGSDIDRNRFDAASSSTPVWLSGLSCSSSDSTLTDCTHDVFGSSRCTHSQDVALLCEGDGALRLGGYYSSYTTSGRLEIYYNGVWGTVCDDYFDQTDANVACRQLGFDSASNYGTVGLSGYTSYSQGSGTIWLSNLACTSSDLMLSMCSHSGFGSNFYCSHSEDVAVTCTHSAASDTIRLVAKGERTSSNLTAGRLEVYHNGQWGTVCSTGFYSTETLVACRQLGFSSYIDHEIVGTYSSNRFDAASSSTPIWLSGLSCSSSDYGLFQCSHDTVGSNYCSHSEDIAVFCLGNGALRLGSYHSSYTTSGRLEIYYNGEWGTVCDDSFDQTDADVACRQLGFDSASNWGNVASLGFTEGSGTIWLDDLGCTSSDLTLAMCSHNVYGLGHSDCSHSEDVAVSCSHGLYTSPRPTTSSSITNLSVGAISGIVVAIVVVFILLIVTTVSCAIRARVQGGRLQNVHRGTTAANSNFPATILMTSASAGSSSNFAYAPIPQEPPPPYPGTPTDGAFSDFVAAPQTQQSQAQQQPVSSSHEYTTHENPPPTQEAPPYGTSTNAPYYPEPPATESDHEFEGAAETSDTAPLLNPRVSDSDNIAVQSPDHYEAEPVPGHGVAAELTVAPAMVNSDDPPPSDELPPFPLSEPVYPSTDDGVVSYPTSTDDSDMKSQAPPSDKD